MLINCAAYQDGKKLSDIPVEDISEFVTLPGCFVWVALKDATEEELALMQEEFGLHELAVEDAHHGHQRPKIEEYGNSLFVVLHALELNNGELQLGEVDVFVGDRYVLSNRSRSNAGFTAVRSKCESESELLKQGPAFVLYSLMDAVVERYFPVVEALETELWRIEELIFSAPSQRSTLEQLYQLKQKTITFKHAVSPLMEAVGKLEGGRVPRIVAGSTEYFRDIHDHLHRINSAVDSIRDTISTAIQVNLSMIGIDDNRINKRLAAWAAIFAVATCMVGVWGMNFRYMPELDWKYGYPLAVAAVLSTSSYLYYRFRKSGWL